MSFEMAMMAKLGLTRDALGETRLHVNSLTLIPRLPYKHIASRFCDEVELNEIFT
jgi:hypothetical protein